MKPEDMDVKYTDYVSPVSFHYILCENLDKILNDLTDIYVSPIERYSYLLFHMLDTINHIRLFGDELKNLDMNDLEIEIREFICKKYYGSTYNELHKYLYYDNPDDFPEISPIVNIVEKIPKELNVSTTVSTLMNRLLAAEDEKQKAMLSIIQLEKDLWDEIELYIRKLILDEVNHFDEFYTYAKEHYKTTLRQLSKETVLYKQSRLEKLSPEIWEKVLLNEESAMKLAIQGKFEHGAVIEEEQYTRFPFNMRLEMNRLGEELKLLLEIYEDDRLFFPDEVLEEHAREFNSLNPFLYNTLFELILRHNIIVCGMHPELKPKFEAWLNSEEENVTEKANAISKSNVLPQIYTTDKASAYWDKLRTEGFVDKDNQLVEGVTNLQVALIASKMSKAIQKTNKWKMFEMFWGKTNLGKEKIDKPFSSKNEILACFK